MDVLASRGLQYGGVAFGMENIVKTGIRWILYGVAFVIILFAILIISLRYSTPILNTKKEYFVKWGEQVLQVPVSIQSLRAQWRGFYPEISFVNVNVGGKKSDQINLHIQKLSVSIDIWHSLLKLKLLPRQVDIDGAKIAIYQNKAQKDKQPMPQIDLVTWQELEGISYWLLSQADVNISRVDVFWYSRTGEVLPLQNVSLQIVNEPWRHSITGGFEIANAQPTKVNFVIKNISAPFSFSNLSAQAYLRVNNADVIQWMKFIPFTFNTVTVKKGLINGEFWVTWESGLIKKIQSVLNIHEMDLSYLKKQHLKLTDFQGNFAWQPEGSGWKFSADRLKGAINDHPWQETRMSVAKSDKNYQLSVDYLRMQDLYIFLALDILPNNVAEILTELKPHGEIKDLILDANLPISKLSDLRISAKLINLSVSPYGVYPGFSGLNGYVSLAQQGGDLQLSSNNFSFTWAQLYQGTRQLSHLQLVAHWVPEQDLEKWTITQLDLGDDRLSLQANGNITTLHGKEAHWQMHANYSFNDLSKAALYLPAKILPVKTVKWLDQSLKKGRITGVMDVQDKHIQTAAKFDQVILHFSKNWPDLENLQGEANWAGQKITLNYAKASMLDNRVEISSASVDDLSKPILVIQGSSKTDFSKALPVIFHSPLSVKRDFSNFSMQGPLQLSLNLKIPFSPVPTQVQGQVQFQNTSILFGMPWLNITNLNGQFSFTNKVFSSKPISGIFLEEPITMALSSQNQKADNLFLDVNGKLNVAVLKKHLSSPTLRDVSGSANFNTRILVQGTGSDSRISVTGTGDLKDIQISNIPAPFSKSMGDPGTLNVIASYRPKSAPLIRAEFANVFSVALKLNPQNFSVFNGEIHLGPGSADFQELPNFLITANLSQMSWSDWKAYFDTYHSENADGNFLKEIREMQLRIARLDALNNSWSNVFLQITPGTQSLSIHIQSPAANGELDIPFDKHRTWWLNFENLNWPESKGGPASTLDPTSIPSINARIKNLQFGKKALGDVQLITARHPSGVTINKLTSHLPDADLSLKGFWYKTGLENHTSLVGYLNCVNLGNLLNQWNYPKTLEGGKGFISFNLNWRASVFNFSPEILNGPVKIELKSGRVLKISQSAQSHLSLVRLLNILSISTLPNLFFDFHGMKEGGLPFSDMKGDFMFSEGVARTDNFYMNGSVAQVWLKGKIGFADERYDLTLEVAPYVTASLPIIAGVAGGPIAGGVTWVAEKLVGSTIGKAIGKTYKVTGTWQKPIITKVEK